MGTIDSLKGRCNFWVWKVKLRSALNLRFFKDANTFIPIGLTYGMMAFSQPLSNEFIASDIIYSIWLHFVHFENVGQSKCHFRASNQIKSQTGLKMLHVNMPNRTFGPNHAPLDQKFLLIGTSWLYRSIIRLVCMDTLLNWSLLHVFTLTYCFLKPFENV